jgi:hypothetical protein
MGTERIIVMSRHESRQKLACEFSATNIVTERGGLRGRKTTCVTSREATICTSCCFTTMS